MFGRINNSQNKKQQPIPGDKNVQKEAELEEDRKSVQSMGNEAANVELLNDILTLSTLKVRADVKEESFTHTHYESYIQIYKDPKTAIEKYKRYKELKKKTKR